MPTPPSHTPTGPFAGLELLSSAVVLVDGRLVIRYINPGAENLFAVSQRKLLGHPLERLLGSPPGLGAALDNALRTNWSYTGQDLTVTRADGRNQSRIGIRRPAGFDIGIPFHPSRRHAMTISILVIILGGAVRRHAHIALWRAAGRIDDLVIASPGSGEQSGIAAPAGLLEALGIAFETNRARR